MSTILITSYRSLSPVYNYINIWDVPSRRVIVLAFTFTPPADVGVMTQATSQTSCCTTGRLTGTVPSKEHWLLSVAAYRRVS